VDEEGSNTEWSAGPQERNGPHIRHGSQARRGVHQRGDGIDQDGTGGDIAVDPALEGQFDVG